MQVFTPKLRQVDRSVHSAPRCSRTPSSGIAESALAIGGLARNQRATTSLNPSKTRSSEMVSCAPAWNSGPGTVSVQGGAAGWAVPTALHLRLSSPGSRPRRTRGRAAKGGAGGWPPSRYLASDVVDGERGQKADGGGEPGEVVVFFEGLGDHGVGEHGEDAAGCDGRDERDELGRCVFQG